MFKVVETGSDDSFSDEESPKTRSNILTRRPSYRKILNDLGGGEITGEIIIFYNRSFYIYIYIKDLFMPCDIDIG